MNIWWIRRDLRLHDNPALHSAMAGGSGVLPVFVLDPKLLEKPAEKRAPFMYAGLRALETDLKKIGSALILRNGNPAEEIRHLASDVNADKVYAEEDYSPYAIKRDDEVSRMVDLQLVHGLGVHHPSVVTKTDGSPYTIFTPFSRAWMTLSLNDEPLPSPSRLTPPPPLDSAIIPDIESPAAFPAGEEEALGRLNNFLDHGIRDYAKHRDRMDLDGTSSLSPYLRFGMLSARTVVTRAQALVRESTDPLVKKGCESWINELIWREFYQSILYHFPHVLAEAFNPTRRNIPWRNAPEELSAWQEGRTGYPIVDAGMRQMLGTGWMHNRARMITASFLIKDLLINWQDGERWFMRNLVDGEPAANNGGWQWSAGTGTDAAPYFRIFNPVLQGRKFDPNGDYVRRWVPELQQVPTNKIHSPWTMTVDEQHKTGLVIGRDYPIPIVDHAVARVRALEAYNTR